VAFLVSLELQPGQVAKFLADRWGGAELRRPSSAREQQQLERRVAAYCEETWTGRREEWTVAQHI